MIMNVEFSKKELEQLVDAIWAAKDTHYTDEGIAQYDELLGKVCQALSQAE
jgi:hypothetical protein